MNLAINKSNWKKVKFGSVVKKISNKINPNEYNSDIVVEGGHINKRDLQIRNYKNKKKLGYLGPAFHMGFKKEQTLYVSRNPHLMKVGYPSFNGICANTTYILETINESILRNDLIPFIMLSDRFIEQSISNVRGGVNPYVNWGDLDCIEIHIPPTKKEQADLSTLLWSMNEVNENNLKLEESLKIARNAFFKNLMHVSKGEKVPLSKILIPKKEKSKKPHIYEKFIGLEDINSGDFTINNFSESNNIESVGSIIKKNDLCYSKLRPYLDKAFISPFDAISTSELLIYDTKLVSKEYVLYHFHSEPFINYVSRMGYGTKMPRVNNKIIGAFPILIPKDEKVILEKLKKFSESLSDLKLKLLHSKKLQVSLINQIF
tara:strand:+ start:2384 stop:3508 length:1125 start_codon:yes stop_codon:yes gene_type:complete